MLRDWQRAWKAFAERFSTEALQSLANALAADSPLINQGVSVYPNPSNCEGPEPPEWLDPVAFCCWAGGGYRTALQVAEAFGDACWHCDQRMGTSQAAGWWCCWWDNTPRVKAFADLLAEVRDEIQRRRLGRLYSSAPDQTEVRA
jgi:hypothetical protein